MKFRNRFGKVARAGSLCQIKENARLGGAETAGNVPMYAFSSFMFVFALLALGLYTALPALLLFVPVYVLRIRNEEKVLRAALPGYTEYCERTRWRMVPGV
jgi:hypothetical protein